MSFGLQNMVTKPDDNMPCPFVEFEDTTTNLVPIKTDVKGAVELVLPVVPVKNANKYPDMFSHLAKLTVSEARCMCALNICSLQYRF